VEVLVAIFVMAIGMITLLTLFPLGLLSMAQAIKDERCGQAAANAIALDNLWDFRHGAPFFDASGVQHMLTYYDTTQVSPAVPVYWAKDPHDAGNTGKFSNPNLPTTAPAMPAISSGAGYPLYFDPLGVKLGYPTMLGQMAGNDGVAPGIQRVPVEKVGTPPPVLTGMNDHVMSTKAPFTPAPDPNIRWFSLLDDIEFDNNGLPTGTAPVLREDRYTWAYMFRMPNVANTTQVEMSIVAYSGRPQLAGEATFKASWSRAGNSVTLDHTGLAAPAVRKGGWILDGTVIAPGNAPNTNGFFYRVVNVNELGNSTELELQTFRQGTTAGSDQSLGFVVVMDGVVEVFERKVGPPITNIPW
jgi:hypothetical protein